MEKNILEFLSAVSMPYGFIVIVCSEPKLYSLLKVHVSLIFWSLIITSIISLLLTETL